MCLFVSEWDTNRGGRYEQLREAPCGPSTFHVLIFPRLWDLSPSIFPQMFGWTWGLSIGTITPATVQILSQCFCFQTSASAAVNPECSLWLGHKEVTHIEGTVGGLDLQGPTDAEIPKAIYVKTPPYNGMFFSYLHSCWHRRLHPIDALLCFAGTATAHAHVSNDNYVKYASFHRKLIWSSCGSANPTVWCSRIRKPVDHWRINRIFLILDLFFPSRDMTCQISTYFSF